MKATLGGKDARCDGNSRAYNPDLKIANNNFEIAKGTVLGFGGRRNSPLFYELALLCPLLINHLARFSRDSKSCSSMKILNGKRFWCNML
jgi:hypothetical protein